MSLKLRIKDYIADSFTHGKIFGLIPDKQMATLNFFVKFGRLPDLKNPKTFSEMIQWMKLYGKLENNAKYVDKYKVRKFVGSTVGKEYLVPLLGVWDNFDDIDFTKLPNEFVLKATHGSFYNYICKDKSKLDRKKLEKSMNKWLNENFYKKTRETQYKYCTPKIICEKYLEDESGGLTDYKILCKNGEPKIIEVHKDRFIGHQVANMDFNWNRLPINVANKSHNMEKAPARPNNLKIMYEVAKKLSRSFPFVRVDLYSVDNKVYFSELTFTPANGLLIYDSVKTDIKLGKLIDIKRYK